MVSLNIIHKKYKHTLGGKVLKKHKHILHLRLGVYMMEVFMKLIDPNKIPKLGGIQISPYIYLL